MITTLHSHRASTPRFPRRVSSAAEGVATNNCARIAHVVVRCPVVHTARHVDAVCCVAAEAALVSLGQRVSLGICPEPAPPRCRRRQGGGRSSRPPRALQAAAAAAATRASRRTQCGPCSFRCFDKRSSVKACVL
eukprot:6675563-Prymnesium_polylepis.1